MSHNVYGKVDSIPKHASRYRLYSYPTRHEFYKYAHIVIPSTDCGDINLMLSAGVNADNILAADVNPRAVRAALNYGVKAIHKDIVTLVEQTLNAGVKVGSINLDYCVSPISTVDDLALVLRSNVKYVFYTFCQRSGKGLPNAEARRAFIVQKTGQNPVAEWNYLSWSKDSAGHNMTCMVFQGSGKQKTSLFDSLDEKNAWEKQALNNWMKLTREAMPEIKETNSKRSEGSKKAWITRKRKAAGG